VVNIIGHQNHSKEVNSLDYSNYLGDVVLPNGYSEIFNEMSQDLNIKFNSKVTEITKISKNFYSIRTENGENFYTEKVVVTVPLGVLKKNIIKFSPPLPTKKLDSIQKLGVGLLNKVIVEFEKDSLKDLPKMIALVPNRKYSEIFHHSNPRQ
jgi:protoporphyrinogen oxidase